MVTTSIASSRRGFTLVELAIVLVVIGLLVGGVVKGAELIYNARVTSAISQMKSYQAAMMAFREKYNYMPGDFLFAQSSLLDCSPATGCENGNGDGKIGTPMNPWRNEGLNVLSAENNQFWKHLALADMISGVNGRSTVMRWGEAIPKSSLRGGGYSVVQGELLWIDTAAMQGVVLRLHECLECANLEDVDNGNDLSLTASETAAIDRKIDDGMPTTGEVRGMGYGLNENDRCTASDGVDGIYNESNTQRVCVLAFRLQM